jgi:hypothetical protein
MPLTIEGTFKDGKVELNETPQGLREAKVLVTFLEPSRGKPHPQMMVSGQFSGPPEKMSTEEDFRSAEWRGASNDDN